MFPQKRRKRNDLRNTQSPDEAERDRDPEVQVAPWQGAPQMRTADLAPHMQGWREGRKVRAHAWTAVDSRLGGILVRDIYHYTTRMGTFIQDGNGGPWLFSPVSVGFGSVSDAQGMNKITSRYGWWMRRDRRGGGPRWESSEGDIVSEETLTPRASTPPRRIVSTQRSPFQVVGAVTVAVETPSEDKLVLTHLQRG